MILSFSMLADRAMIASILLLSILIQSLILLIPHETVHLACVSSLIIFFLTWPGVSYLDGVIFKKLDKVYRNKHLMKMFYDQIALLLYLIGEIFMLNGSLHGYYWLVVSIIISFLKASLDAWVLFVD